MHRVEQQLVDMEIKPRPSADSPSHCALPPLKGGDHGDSGVRAATGCINSKLDEFNRLELKLDYDDARKEDPEPTIGSGFYFERERRVFVSALSFYLSFAEFLIIC